MEDKPEINLLNGNFSYPGAYYNFDDQCKLYFGHNSTYCKEQELKNVNLVISNLKAFNY